MLTLKAEKAAIKTISPLELSLRDCLLLSEIPPGACSHFLSYTSLSSFPGFLPPSAHSLSLLRSLLVGAREYLFNLVYISLNSPTLNLSSVFKKNPIPLSGSTFSTFIHSSHLFMSLSPSLLPILASFK